MNPTIAILCCRRCIYQLLNIFTSSNYLYRYIAYWWRPTINVMLPPCMALAGGGMGTFRHLEGKLLTLDPACKTLNFPPLLSLRLFSSISSNPFISFISFILIKQISSQPSAPKHSPDPSFIRFHPVQRNNCDYAATTEQSIFQVPTRFPSSTRSSIQNLSEPLLQRSQYYNLIQCYNLVQSYDQFPKSFSHTIDCTRTQSNRCSHLPF